MVLLATLLARPAALPLPCCRGLPVSRQNKCHNVFCILCFGEADLKVPAFQNIGVRKLLEATATPKVIDKSRTTSMMPEATTATRVTMGNGIVMLLRANLQTLCSCSSVD